MSRAPAVRSRIVPRSEPPFDLLHDPLLEDVVHGGPVARERYATRWGDTDALRRLSEAKRAPLDPALAAALAAYHRRLGAPAASLASIDRLARGEVVCAVTGQQPAPLGGPLYTLHKTACAVGLSAAVEARTGVPCVPVFWMHGEDSDFVEIRGATIADAGLTLRDLALPDDVHGEGGLVGGLPVGSLDPLHAAAAACWAELPGVRDARAVLEAAMRAAGDLGESSSALMLALFGSAGLVVIDPRLPEFRAAARPVIDRYLERAEPLTAAARQAGAMLEERIGRRPLSDASLDSFVFEIEDGIRRKIGVAEARTKPGCVLSPSVALRPVVQDGVLPTVAMACGSAELAYLAQIREVFEGLDVRAASPVPRLSATWLPPAAVTLVERSGAEPWSLVAAADQVIRDLAEREVPDRVRRALEEARGETGRSLEQLGEAVREVDASLPQMVSSARGKVDYQFARLHDGLVGKVRHRLERQHPEWLRLRYYLLPGDRLQERKLAALEVVAYRGAGAAAELCTLATEQAHRVASGSHEHLLLDL